jgi:hypothetical protein
VFKVKLDKNGGIARYKARWVARGFTQIAGIEYDETYAAVAKPVSIRMLMAIVAHYDLGCKHYDIITAFLNAMIGDRKIYVEQPHGFEVDNHNNNSQSLVCLLLRALYGLKQSPLLWYEELTKFLDSLGFAALCGDACVFQHAYTHAIIIIYVDDLVLMALKTAIIDDFAEQLKSRFELSELGELSFYLRRRITRECTYGTTYVCRDAYIDQLLERFHLANVDPVGTPMEANHKLIATTDDYIQSNNQL